jgi:CBS domain-containing protein
MVDKNFHTLPVVEGGLLVGVVGKEDVLRTLLGGAPA